MESTWNTQKRRKIKEIKYDNGKILESFKNKILFLTFYHYSIFISLYCVHYFIFLYYLNNNNNLETIRSKNTPDF